MTILAICFLTILASCGAEPSMPEAPASSTTSTPTPVPPAPPAPPPPKPPPPQPPPPPKLPGLPPQATTPEEPLPIVTPPSTLPESPLPPWLHREHGILFQEDFEDGSAEGFFLEGKTYIDRWGDNGILSLSGERVRAAANVYIHEWTDYVAKARFKVISGILKVCFREGHGAGNYLLHVEPRGLELFKRIGQDIFPLGGWDGEIPLNQWHTLEIAVEGTYIKIYLDSDLKYHYIDDELPVRAGGLAFLAEEGSQALIDNIVVTGVKIVQEAKWVKTGGPSGGLGYDIRIHPQDKDIMFVTDNPSGVNKSYDRGNTWVARNEGITARTGPSEDGIPIFCLTIDPNNPEIVWAGTQFMRGIFKSIDGGETWVKKDKGVGEWNEITFRGFAVAPGNSNVVLAAAEVDTGRIYLDLQIVKGKIYQTEDGGESWYPVWEGDNLARVIIFDPVDPSIVYASTGIFDRVANNETGLGVLKSADGGKTWQQISSGLESLYVGFLEIHPRDHKTLFAAAGEFTQASLLNVGGIYRTTDGGEHWIEILSEEEYKGIDVYHSNCFTVVTVAPSNPEVIYAGSPFAFYRSDDGGETWHRFNRMEEQTWGPPGIQVGVPISAVVDPQDPMTVFVNAYGGGAFKSTDGGKNWSDCSKGYTGAGIWSLSVCPSNPDAIYTVAKNGPFRSLDGGQHWVGIAHGIGPSENQWSSIAVNPANPKEVLLCHLLWPRIYKSDNSGDSWRKVFEAQISQQDYLDKHGFKAIAYAPSNQKIIYAGMHAWRQAGVRRSFGIYKSVDGGESWREINHGLEKCDKSINCIVVHPQDPDIVYVGSARDGVYKSINGGETWELTNKGLISLDVRSLAIDPHDSDTVYTGLAEGAGVFKTTNGGELWEAINNGLAVECPSYLQRVGQVRPGVSLVKPKRPTGVDYYSLPWSIVTSIVVDPNNSQLVYAGDERLGVYVSADGGSSWTPINSGLTTRAVAALAISAGGRVLYAATSGEGVFRLELR